MHSSQVSLQQQQQQQQHQQKASSIPRRGGGGSGVGGAVTGGVVSDADSVRGGADNRSLRGSRRDIASKSVDYSEMDTVREGDTLRRRARSRSTDDVTKGDSRLILNSGILKHMLQPMPGEHDCGEEDSAGDGGGGRKWGTRGREGSYRIPRNEFDEQDLTESPTSDQQLYDAACYATTPSPSTTTRASLLILLISQLHPSHLLLSAPLPPPSCCLLPVH